MNSSRPTHALNIHLPLGLSVRPEGPVERQIAIGTSIRPEILHIDSSAEEPRGETLRCLSTRPQALISYPPPTSAVGCYTGTTIDGRYRIEGVLGEGGMGVVYLARHLVIDKKVAIKILRPEFARRAETKARFRQEARAASSVENPHIVDVSDFGTLQDGSTYLVMEYLEGVPLSSLTKDEKPVDLDKAIDITRQIAEGLAEVHDRGIIHRDLKPDNIFLVKEGEREDFVKILDFGIAKVLESTEARMTCAGSLFGTPSYMSPEQAAGMPVDARTDVYAVGIIMYELASGRVPFDADTLMGILTQHLYKKPMPLRNMLGESNTSFGLDAIISKALSKAPDLRYQSMRDLGADLAALAEGRTPGALVEMVFRSKSGRPDVAPAPPPAPAAEPVDEPASVPLVLREMPAPIPATPRPRPRTRWGLYAGGTAILVACGLVMGVLAQGSRSSAADAPARAGLASPSPEQVLLSAEPMDAHIFLRGLDLGTGPFLFQVPKGQTLALEIRREGYTSKTVILEGHEKRLGIKLVTSAGLRSR